MLPPQNLQNDLFPAALPEDIHHLGKKFDHHLLISLGEYGSGNLHRTEQRLAHFVEAAEKDGQRICVHTCAKEEDVQKVNFFRFAAAPAFRTFCIGKGVQGLSLDYALSKNHTSVPAFGERQGEVKPLTRMRYSHFGW